MNFFNSVNPVEYVDSFRVLGIAMMVLGVGLLTFVGFALFKSEKECDCGS